MKKMIIVFAMALGEGTTCAQSVAQTVTTLMNKMTDIESRLSSYPAPAVFASMKDIYFGDGFIAFSNSDGKQTAYIGTDTSGNGALLIDGNRKFIEDPSAQFKDLAQRLANIDTQLTQFKTMKNIYFGDGFIMFSNSDGKQAAYIGADKGGQGALLINGDRKYDYSEVWRSAIRTGVDPGSVVAVSLDGNLVELSHKSYDRTVVGVVSGAGGLSPSIQTGARRDDSADLIVAVAGQVYVRVNAENGSIRVGDLLVSSSRPGVAMRSADWVPGTVIGKAVEPFEAKSAADEGLVRMLVMNH
jgi:hypothetical protein